MKETHRDLTLNRSIEQSARGTLVPLAVALAKVVVHRVSHHSRHGNIALPPRGRKLVREVIVLDVLVR